MDFLFYFGKDNSIESEIFFKNISLVTYKWGVVFITWNNFLLSLLGIIFYPYFYTEGTPVPSRKQNIINAYNGTIIIIKLLLLTYILETTIYYLIGVYYKRIGNEEKSKEFMRIYK